MALEITNVHSPSDCDFCNRRATGKSVPDLRIVACCSYTPHRTHIPKSPRDTPTSSPKSRIRRTRLARHRWPKSAYSNSLNTVSSMDLLARSPQANRMETSSGTDDFPSGSGDTSTPYRRRVCTMPSRQARPHEFSTDTDPLNFYRLRSFSVTSRGSVVNLGDQVCFRSRSDFSMTSGGSKSSLGTDLDSRERPSSSTSTAMSEVHHYRVLVVGEEGVGKTSLIAQFMTSEYLTARSDFSTERKDSAENATVSILLDGEEADLDFVESRNVTPPLEDFVNADAIIVTYTVTDRNSFRRAVLCLSTMKNIANRQPPSSLPLGPGLRSKAVILVGNKSDLARVRSVTTENGRSVANKYDVKFIETSVIIHHNVDELLVGALSQVRLKARQAEVLSCKNHAKFTKRAKNLWFRLLHKCDLRFNSCDNLQQL